MPAVYSIRILATAGLTVASGFVGPIVPDGLVYVVRDIDARSNTGITGDQLAFYNQTAGILWAPQLVAGGSDEGFQWRGRQVYNPGERVMVQSFSGEWTVSISGYQLTLP